MWCNTSDGHDTHMPVDGSGTIQKRAEPPCLCLPEKSKQMRTTFGTTNGKKERTSEPVLDVVNLAKDLNELTFQERERVMEEVHGVAEIPDETPEFVAKSLAALDRAIEIIPKRKRRAMEKAFFLRPSFATDAQFKLLFLRAEEFDATNAATRMVAYFEAKRILFGDAKLAKKRITLDDLGPGDIQYTFYSQVADLPISGADKRQYVDASGRPILYTNIMNLDFDNMHCVARGVWYIGMSMILPEDVDDEDTPPTVTSMKGLCNVLHIPLDSGALQLSLSTVVHGCHQAVSLFLMSLPFRFTSVHICCNSPAMHPVISVMQKFLGKRVRVRMRMHVGSPLEIRYALLPFGIRCPPNVVRIPESHSTTTNKFESEMNQYLENKRETERQQESIQLEREVKSGILLYPRNHLKDVLIGRGQSYKGHPGNQFHQDLVDSSLVQYAAATDNFEKTCISMNIVQTIQDAGGRFLMLVEGKGWKILESSIARDKTSANFRAKITKKQKTASKEQETLECNNITLNSRQEFLLMNDSYTWSHPTPRRDR